MNIQCFNWVQEVDASINQDNKQVEDNKMLNKVTHNLVYMLPTVANNKGSPTLSRPITW